ncbi:MAG TPA: DUF4124 domain-containing protein, partial [Gammaproteobacteria bacterium]
MTRPSVLVALALLATSVAGADVYRCVTENGVVRYGATPCRDGDAEKLAIESDPTDVQSVRERTENRKERIETLEEAEAEAGKAAADAAKKAEEKQRQCDAARDRLQRLMIARRVTVGEGENRRYLESEEIVQRRQDAGNDVKELCGD